MRRSVVSVIGVIWLAVSGCGTDEDTGAVVSAPPVDTGAVAVAVTPPSIPEPVASTRDVAVDETASLVVIGDSLAGTAWVEQYRAHLESALGRAVQAEVLNGMSVPEALETVSAEGTPAQEALAAADVIIVQTGFNNALPDPETGIGCGGSLGSDFMVWIRSTEPGCLAEGVATYGALYDAIFVGVKELRAGKPTVYITTGTIDGNIDVNTDGLVAAVAEADRAEALDWALAAYERWNSMLSERAAAAGFAYVDLYHAFNGPDGTQPPGDLSSNGAHPSAKGDLLITEMLAEVDLGTLG